MPPLLHPGGDGNVDHKSVFRYKTTAFGIRLRGTPEGLKAPHSPYTLRPVAYCPASLASLGEGKSHLCNHGPSEPQKDRGPRPSANWTASPLHPASKPRHGDRRLRPRTTLHPTPRVSSLLRLGGEMFPSHWLLTISRDSLPRSWKSLATPA